MILQRPNMGQISFTRIRVSTGEERKFDRHSTDRLHYHTKGSTKPDECFYVLGNALPRYPIDTTKLFCARRYYSTLSCTGTPNVHVTRRFLLAKVGCGSVQEPQGIITYIHYRSWSMRLIYASRVAYQLFVTYTLVSRSSTHMGPRSRYR